MRILLSGTLPAHSVGGRRLHALQRDLAANAQPIQPIPEWAPPESSVHWATVLAGVCECNETANDHKVAPLAAHMKY